MKPALESQATELTASYLNTGNVHFVLLVVAMLLVLFYYEHQRQLKKFKKSWKDRLDTCLLGMKDSHRKRMNGFKVQPMSMKAEWSTLKSQMERRTEELWTLKTDVTNQLASLKLDFQRHSAQLLSKDKPPLPASVTSYVNVKLQSLKSYVDQEMSKTLLMHEKASKMLQQPLD